MKKIRFYVTLICARLVYLAIKLLNKSSGTSFVGMFCLKICPDFLEYCKHYIKTAINVTGTNGKTTTSGLLAHILECGRNSVIHNVVGANMLTGMTNVLALNVGPGKRFDYAVLESDEAYLRKLYDHFSSEFLVVTNLFRDQLDRYGELSTTASFIQNAIDKNKGLRLMLNADDPLVTNFGSGREAFYYGFEEIEYCSDVHNSNSPSEVEVFSCICGNPLNYSKRFFAQEGHYHCDKCAYTRPDPYYKGYLKLYSDYSELTIKAQDGSEYNSRINLIGLYNAYNALAAISQAMLLGVPTSVIKEAVSSYKTMSGRAERTEIKGHSTIIQLIKNPTGANEVLKTVDLSSHIVIAMNDNYADGRDMSWLWDTDFEKLNKVTNPIIASGVRAYDVATRLKYAGLSSDKIIVEQNLYSAIELAANSAKEGEKLTIMPSYTALLKINKMKF